MRAGCVCTALRREALRFISLREDFRTARVDGRSLLELFSGEGMEAQIGQGAAGGIGGGGGASGSPAARK